MLDIMYMRVIITVLSFVAFLGIVAWAYSSTQKDRFNEAANLPFADDEMQHRTVVKHVLASHPSAADESIGATPDSTTPSERNSGGTTHG